MKTLETIKSYAMTGVAALFIAFGISYFQPQDEYRVPRILLPVYNALGNVGLAIGMIVLGLIIIVLAYRKMKKYAANTLLLLGFAGLVLLGGLVAQYFYPDGKRANINTVKEMIEKQPAAAEGATVSANDQAGVDDASTSYEVFNTPVFKDAQLNQWATELEDAVVATKNAADNKDAQAYETNAKLAKDIFAKMRKHKNDSEDVVKASTYLAEMNSKFYAIKKP